MIPISIFFAVSKAHGNCMGIQEPCQKRVGQGETCVHFHPFPIEPAHPYIVDHPCHHFLPGTIDGVAKAEVRAVLEGTQVLLASQMKRSILEKIKLYFLQTATSYVEDLNLPIHCHIGFQHLPTLNHAESIF